MQRQREQRQEPPQGFWLFAAIGIPTFYKMVYPSIFNVAAMGSYETKMESQVALLQNRRFYAQKNRPRMGTVFWRREGFPGRLGQWSSSQWSLCVAARAAFYNSLAHWASASLLPPQVALGSALPTRRRPAGLASAPVSLGRKFLYLYSLDGFLPTCGRPFLSNPSLLLAKQKNTPWVFLCFGGERGIRTLDTLMRYTRFPVVRLRPARPSLQMGEGQIRFTQL